MITRSRDEGLIIVEQSTMPGGDDSGGHESVLPSSDCVLTYLYKRVYGLVSE